MNRQIILASHGNMAVETQKTVEMILGKQEGLHSCSVTETDNLETATEKCRSLVKSLQAAADEIYILCDLMGGTPSKAAFVVASERPNTFIITGFNLGLIIDMLIRSNQSLTTKEWVETGKNMVAALEVPTHTI
ncbi:PTS sugar transporter subunit IIA [Camelliibacillus cellulosilyticus]|uniref:PTS sugar transporter subunit IIA n=1 Tax=Camelliibacillus cellulosilyticus TaxID=2174486 RepID=A0ABV9GSR6_9BACL